VELTDTHEKQILTNGEPTDTHRKQKPTNGGTDRHSWKTKTNQRWNRQTLIENKNKPTVEPIDTPAVPCNCNSKYPLSIFVTEKLNDIKEAVNPKEDNTMDKRRKTKDKL
jgi:hypothetical protein